MNPTRIGYLRNIGSDEITTHKIGTIGTTPPSRTRGEQVNGGTKTARGTVTTNAETRITEGEIIIREMSVGNRSQNKQ